VNYECSHCGYKFEPLEEEAIGPFCDCARCGGLAVLEEGPQAKPEADPFALPDDEDDEFTGKTGAVPLTPGLFNGYFQEAQGGAAPAAAPLDVEAAAPVSRVMRDEFESGNIHREPTMLSAEGDVAAPAPSDEGASWGSLYEGGHATPGKVEGERLVSMPSAVTPQVDPIAFAQQPMDVPAPLEPVADADADGGDEEAQWEVREVGDPYAGLPRPPGMSVEVSEELPTIHEEQTHLPGGIDGFEAVDASTDADEDYGDDVLAFDMDGDDDVDEESEIERPDALGATAIEVPSGPAAAADADDWGGADSAWGEDDEPTPPDGVDLNDPKAVPLPIDLPVPPDQSAAEDGQPPLDFNSPTELDEADAALDPFATEHLPSPQDYETVMEKPAANEDGPTLPFASLLSGQVLIGGDTEEEAAPAAAEGEYLEEDKELAEISDRMRVSDLAQDPGQSAEWVVSVPGAPPPLKPKLRTPSVGGEEVSGSSLKLPALQVPQETMEVKPRTGPRAKGTAKAAVPPSKPRLFTGATIFGLIAVSLGFLVSGAAGGFFLVMSQRKAAPISGPAKAKELLGQANKMLHDGQVEEAITVLEEARSYDQTLADVQRSLGSAYAQIGQTKKAAKAYGYYVRLSPNAIDAEEIREMLTAHLGRDP